MVKGKIILSVILILMVVSTSFAFYLYIGQPKSDVIAAIGEPNDVQVSVDAITGKIERCQWGSERVGTMVVIYFRDGKVLRFETKGKVY